MSRANKIRYFLSLIILGASFALLSYAYLSSNKSSELLKVSFLDVGQGDAIFIESPTGVQVLVDAGPDKIVLSRLSEAMAFYDNSIDIVIATHPDKDHIGGIPSVLNKYKVDILLESGSKADNGIYDEVENISNDLVKAGSLIKETAYKGQSIDIGGGAKIDILYPDREVDNIDTNEASIVALLSYGDTTFLLTGDAGFEVEYRLLRDKRLHKVTVLKVGHHGSQYSTGNIFLERVKPDFSIISSGKNNYGHPAQGVIKNLSLFKSEIIRTDEKGTIVFSTNGLTASYTSER